MRRFNKALRTVGCHALRIVGFALAVLWGLVRWVAGQFLLMAALILALYLLYGIWQLMGFYSLILAALTFALIWWIAKRSSRSGRLP